MTRAMSRILLLLLACLAACLVGCSGSAGSRISFAVRQYPVFYDPNLAVIAVLPFQNATNARGAGELAAENLAAALQAEGTYRVIPPSQLHEVLGGQALAGVAPENWLRDTEQLRAAGRVQAFIGGRVLADSTVMTGAPIDNPYLDAYVRGSVPEQQAEGEESRAYSPLYHHWYESYPYYGNYEAHAFVALEASLVRVSDGRILYTTPEAVTGGAGTGPYHTARRPTSTQGAMEEATRKLVAAFAAVPVEIRVNPNTALRTARPTAGGQWMFTDTFSATDPTMDVVLVLPAVVARNPFRLTITSVQAPERIMAARDLVWPAGQTTAVVAFSPKEIAAAAGPGTYTVNFYSLGRLVMQQPFTITPGR